MSATGSGPRTLLCLGDPNGIGPEIAVRAALALSPAPVLVGDRGVVEAAVRVTGSDAEVREHRPGRAPEAGLLDLVDVPVLPAAAHRPGRVEPAAGAATLAYARTAIRAAAAGDHRAVVAAPHSETAVRAAGETFSGYPSLLAEMTGTPQDRVFLLLVGGGLRIVHATLHQSLSGALAALDTDRVVAAGHALRRALADLGVPGGRMAVFGIDPHAGEGGLFGDADQRITEPAVARLRADGVPVDGPTGADVLLAEPRHVGYVAAYHDQGHVPVKLLAGRTAVAMAVGTGVPFCSVGHGAAFDLAGTGRADPAALIRALRTVDPAAEVAAE